MKFIVDNLSSGRYNLGVKIAPSMHTIVESARQNYARKDNMRMPRKYLIALFFMTFAGAGHAQPPPQTECPPECVTDSLEIVTWYPSPYNEYEELRLYPTQRDDNYCDNDKIGLMYYDHGGTPSFPENDKIKVCKGIALGWQDLGGDYWKPSTANTDDIYYNTGNVGIGVGESDTVGAKLQINTSSAIKGLVVKAGVNASLASSFGYTGSSQTYQVPSGVTQVTITAYGAQGGGSSSSSSGGLGGSAVATITVTPLEILNVYVGGRGAVGSVIGA